MPEVMINISDAAHKMLVELAAGSGETVPVVLERAIENYRRSVFLSQANQAFAALRQNEALWQAEQEERALWDQAGEYY